MAKSNFTENQLKAAWLKSNGQTDAAVIKSIGVTQSEYYKWKKTDSFNDLLEFISTPTKDKSKAKPVKVVVDYGTRLSEDIDCIKHQREMVRELAEYSVELIKEVREQGVTDMDVRHIPPILKTFMDSLKVLETTTDRVIKHKHWIKDTD